MQEPTTSAARAEGARSHRVAGWTVWAARLAWLLVALLGGEAVEAAIDGRSSAVRWVSAIGAWTIWAVVALALAIPSVRSLTVVRVFAPVAVAAGIAAALAGAPATDLVLYGIPAFGAVAAAYTPEFGIAYAQASAYGDEHRFPLRAPAATGAVAIVLWLGWVPLLLAGPLLLAATMWLVGGLVSAGAIAGAVFLLPRWHRLAQRWLVLVPAGLVVRDPIVLAETLMLRSREVRTISLALADTGAADLTGPASGYALEVATTATVTAVFAGSPSSPEGRAVHLTAFLVAPSRPGRALEVARARGLTVA
ncbi:MAG: hypothetical protein QNM02_00955 [Acidimicrobiia bacterium]|nr:hypothetical protein [Acidimicrobiia bacterium]